EQRVIPANPDGSKSSEYSSRTGNLTANEHGTKDALLPISGGYKDQFSGWAATLIDSLDTLWIMGFRSEFDEAVAAVAEIDF
ncbi:glycoside hydrolase family 47 protein, partial [Escherichia coli]|nr:glycoside hydrolase family 47 protein [Escherichia coli]